MKSLIYLFIYVCFSASAMAKSSFDYSTTELRLINLSDINFLATQNVAFRGNDECTYYGSTDIIDKRGGIFLSSRVCSSIAQKIKARVFLIESNGTKTPTSLIPAGREWEIQLFGMYRVL